MKYIMLLFLRLLKTIDYQYLFNSRMLTTKTFHRFMAHFIDSKRNLTLQRFLRGGVIQHSISRPLLFTVTGFYSAVRGIK